MANATAAAATIKTAIVAVSTVMQVASLARSASRWAFGAPGRAGTVGIAGKWTCIEFSSQPKMCRKSTLELRLFEPTARSFYSADAARNPAMSMMKAAANQSTSVGMAKIMAQARVTGSRNFRRRSENDLAPIAGICPILPWFSNEGPTRNCTASCSRK